MKGIALIAALAVTVTGCATVFDGSHQDFTITTQGDKAPEKTRCLVKNEEGEWRVLPNSVNAIHRDGNTMQVECTNDLQSGIANVTPRFQAEFLLLNIIWDGCLLTASCIIDGATNAFFEYPAAIGVEMKDHATTVALEP